MTGPRFPTPYRIRHEVYTGIAYDTLNNEIPAWEDAVEVDVIGWRVTVKQVLEENTSRQVIEGLLLTPPELAVQVRDRFILPETPDGMGGAYDVTEVRDLSHGFHRWRPGGVAVIRKTPATKPAAVHQL